jgi:glycerol-3-phosphate cytidylyltransferase-like family protein
VVGVVAFAGALREAKKPGPLAADKVVVISRDDEAEGASIADQLEKAGVIESTLWFNLAPAVS